MPLEVDILIGLCIVVIGSTTAIAGAIVGEYLLNLKGS